MGKLIRRMGIPTFAVSALLLVVLIAAYVMGQSLPVLFTDILRRVGMNGGEDYELLFTVPIGDHEKIETMEGVRQIGYITKENLGKFLITRDGQEFELKAQGWNPLKD